MRHGLGAALWSLGLVVGLGGCDRGSREPSPAAPQASAQSAGGQPEDAKSPSPATETPDAEPDTKSDTKPRATTAAAPYRRPGDVAAGVDDFIFWGWSEDGHYYAFETFHAGPQMANCEGEAELTIVDAHTDRYADDGHILLEHADPEAEVCDPPDLRAELALRRAPRLKRFGITADHLGGPVIPQGGPDRFEVTLPDGGPPIALDLLVKHRTTDPMDAADGAAYTLRMTQPGMSKVVVERGGRRRPWTLDYGLAHGMVFVGPKGRYAAIMVAQKMAMPEGVRSTWMSNAVTFR